MKRSAISYVIMVLALLALIAAPFMSYAHCEILAAYLDQDYLTGVGLVRQLAILHSMPDSVSFFGYTHYELYTMLCMIGCLLMILIPIVLGLAVLLLTVVGKTKGKHAAGLILALILILLSVFYMFAVRMAGRIIGMPVSVGAGLAVTLAASVVFGVLAVIQYRMAGKKENK